MKKLFIYQFASCCLVILFACKDQDSPVKPGSGYQACCGAEPVEFVQDSYRIAVPNCFTPNGDNINDLFVPVVTNNFDSVRSFEIFSFGSDAISRLFVSQNHEINDWSSNSWNGRDMDNYKYKGKFTYKIIFITKVGSEIAVQGSGCAILCGEEAAIFYNRYGCFFGSQFIFGKLDSLIPNSESSCFNH